MKNSSRGPFLILVILAAFLAVPQLQGGESTPFKIYGDINYVANKGQWHSNVLYRADVDGGYVFLEQGRITYQLFDMELLREKAGTAHGGSATPSDRMRWHTFRVNFPGSNPTPSIEGQHTLRHYNNYFLGNDKSKWASNVPLFKEVVYQDLYAGIDVAIYSQNNYLKYDVLIDPGTNPSAYSMEYSEMDKISLVGGKLRIETSVGFVEELAPYAYQDKKGRRTEVPCNFVLKNNTVSFEFPEGYNKKLPLVIDPAMIFASFTGSTTDNFGFTATYDNAGNLYAGGIVLSPGGGYPVTGGAYDGTWNGGVDMGITKFDALGQNLGYSTYIGGSGDETPHSLFVSNSDELYIYGLTGSNNFPTTTGAHDTVFSGGTTLALVSNGTSFPSGTDIIVCKLNATGSSLLASTYVGGTLNDGINTSTALRYNYADQFRGEIIVDDLGFSYIASSTYSTNFPVSASAAQDTLAGGQDAVVFKMNPGLTALTWGSYFGGTLDDAAYSIVADDQGNVYFAGGTESPDMHTTPTALDTSYLGGRADGFLAHLSFDGTTIYHATYTGTSGYDQNYFVQRDKLNEIYTVGQTDGAYPNTAGKYGNPGSGQFVHKLDSMLSLSRWSLTFGSGSGAPDISPTAFLVDTCFNIYVSGWGGTVNAPPLGNGGNTIGLDTTIDAWQPTTDGSDLYIFVLPKGAEYLSYATFFGSPSSTEHVDGGTSRFDRNGFVYQAICGGCGGNDDTALTTPGVWSRSNNSTNCNLLALKFQFDLSGINANVAATPANGCHPLTVQFNNTSLGGVEYDWVFGDSSSPNNTSTAFDTSHVYENPGIYEVMLVITDSNSCNIVDTAYTTIEVYPPPDADAGPDMTVDIGNGAVIKGSTANGASWSWSPGQYLDDSTALNPTANVSELTEFILTVISPEGCISKDTMLLDVIPNITIPNAFSPNGDGENEKIFVIPTGIVSLLEFKIFNRWGDLVFQTTDINEGWDGNHNGEEQELGTYVYYLKAVLVDDEPPVVLKGNITLIR